MKRTAFLFPGQGAQYPGMGRDFFDNFASSRETFQEADDLLKMKLSNLIFEGPADRLTQTRYSQLAIFVTSIAMLKVLEKSPTVTAGLSLGEYTALYASNRIGFEEALKVVRIRGDLMHEACEKIPGAMAAVLGMEAALVEEGISGISGVWVANYNCPGQIVISGTKEGVDAASSRLKERGAKRVLPLQVHGAFHSGLMQMAAEGLAPFLDRVPLSESSIRYVMNVSGDFVEESAIRQNLKRQVSESVRWEQGIRAIEREGIDLYIEIGCGKTLSGMNRKIGVTAPTLNVEKVTDLEECIACC